jgi:hypothetical protein
MKRGPDEPKPEIKPNEAARLEAPDRIASAEATMSRNTRLGE